MPFSKYILNERGWIKFILFIILKWHKSFIILVKKCYILPTDGAVGDSENVENQEEQSASTEDSEGLSNKLENLKVTESDKDDKDSNKAESSQPEDSESSVKE